MSDSNSDRAHAFPVALRDEVLQVVSAFPEPRFPCTTFSVKVCGQDISIPYRIYHDPALINATLLVPRQIELLDCLLTRHHSGLVREEHLARIIHSNHEWVPPFVVQLLGEYVIEILYVIQDNITNLSGSMYGQFLKENPEFFAITEQRVRSYWDCYYRSQPREQYVGFQLLESFRSMVGDRV